MIDTGKVRTGQTVAIPASVYNTLMQMVELYRRGSPLLANGNNARPSMTPFRVASSTVYGSNRFEYLMYEQTAIKSAAGADMYVDKIGGLEATGYNISEERNDQSGQFDAYYGNGVLFADLESATGTISPVPGGRVVMAWPEAVEGGIEWRFNEACGVSVTC